MLLAVAVLLAGLVAGATVLAIGHPLFGLLLGFSAVPLALLAWVTGERR